MAAAHLPPPYDAAADAAHAAWAAVTASKDATYASIGLAILTIIVAVAAILNTSRLQNDARKQHLSAASIGVAHALMIYLELIELLGKHPPAQRANTRVLLNMSKPARLDLAQILSNSVDDTALYRMGVNLQTAFIVFEDEVSYAASGRTTKVTNQDMLDCLRDSIKDAGDWDAELAAIRRRVDRDFKGKQKLPPAVVVGEYPLGEPVGDHETSG
jgi:hypothetical protein